MSEGKFAMFGKTFNTVGSSDSNFVIKTKGDVKILWGGKFIDLIKNGKIALENANFFKKVNSKEDIKSDGLYLILNDDSSEVWVSIGGNSILLNNSGEQYISFLEKQELTPELKEVALINIGFNYETLEEAKKANINAGIIYIKELGLIYIVKDGVITEYKAPSLVKDSYDSLKIGDIEIYENVITTTTSLKLNIGNTNYILLSENRTLISGDLVINSGTIMSIGATSVFGYRLYQDELYSVLEVDKLIVRKSIEYPSRIDVTVLEFRSLIQNKELIANTEYRLYNFNNFWQLAGPLKTIFDFLEEGEVVNTFCLIVKAVSDNSYLEDLCFIESDPECIFTYDVSYEKEYIVEGESIISLGIITKMRDKNGNLCNYNFKELKFLRDGIWSYTFGEPDTLSAYSNNVINLSNIRVENIVNDTLVVFEDLDNYAILSEPCSNNIFSNLTSPLYIEGRFNNNTMLENWNPEKNNGSIDSCIFKKAVLKVVIEGTFSKCTFEYAILANTLFTDGTLIFKCCTFLSEIMGTIEVLDDTTKTLIKSDEDKLITVYVDGAVKKLKVVSNSSLAIPSGAILMWSGITIPYGWAICDGENGTPNLVGRFIKATGIVEEVGEITSVLNDRNELTIKLENLPKHSHPHLSHTHELLLSNISGATEDSETLNVSLLLTNYNHGITSTSETVVTSVTGEGVTAETGIIESVSNIGILGGNSLGGIHAHTIEINLEGESQLKGATSVETVPIDSEWPNKAIKIEPRSYALLFIMKL